MSIADKIGVAPQHRVTAQPDGSVIVTVIPPPIAKSPISRIPLTAKQYEGYLRWRVGGEMIQRAMPDLDDDTREIFMSGITPDVWDKMFPEEED